MNELMSEVIEALKSLMEKWEQHLLCNTLICLPISQLRKFLSKLKKYNHFHTKIDPNFENDYPNINYSA